MIDGVQKCVGQTDPHIQIFHPTKNKSGPSLEECLDNGRHELVYNSFVKIEIDVLNTYISDVKITHV